MNRFIVGLLSLVFTFVSFSIAQNDPAAGLIPFSTHVGGPVDTLDLATGNVTITIPIRDKIGKSPFSFSLVANSHLYTFRNINNHNTPAWASGGNAGMFPGSIYVGFWLTQAPASGTLTLTPHYSSATYNCHNQQEAITTGFSVIDATGTQHPVPGGPLDTGNCYPSQLHSVANDGSGYTLDYTVNGPWTIHDKNGNWVSSSNARLATDPDGSTVSYTATLDADGKRSDYKFTDSLNTQVMSSVVNGYGAEQNGLNDTYTYLGGDGSNHTVTVKYTQLTQLTNFGCSPSPTDIPAQKLYFPTEVDTAAGDYYLSYEAPVGYNNPYTTGRIKQITLATGGYVQYAYSGGSNGINCTSGVVPTLTRTVNDSNGNSGTWKYVNSNTSGTADFTVTETGPPDPNNNNISNVTVYSFAGGYQTQAIYHQGTSTVLKTVTTCYGSAGSNPPVPPNCAAPSTTPFFPITETDTYTSLGTSANNRVKTTFDSYGNATSVLNYDFSGTAPTTQTYAFYGQSWNGSACTAYSAGTDIYDTPCYSHTENASNTDVAETKVLYNADGKPGSIYRWTGATENTWLTTSFGYGAGGASAGVLSSVTDPNNTTTTYGNFACNGMLPGSTTYPVSSVGSDFQTWDCNGGMVASKKDVNGNSTSYTYNDPLWRLTNISRPDGGSTSYSYNTGSGTWTTSTTVAVSGTQSLISTTTLDGLGRSVLFQTTDPNSSSGYRYGKTTYNSLGQVVDVYNPYFTTTNGYSSYSYDALGRVLTATDAAQNTVSTSYTNRAIQTTYPAAVNKKTIKQYDGLGRIASVCEVGTAEMGTGPQPCNLDISGTGYLTAYSYNPLGLTQVTTDTTRTFSFDGLGRTTSEANPETGTITYTYDGAGINGSYPAPGDLYQRIWNGITTTYTYDLMHRRIQIAYFDGAGHDTSTPWVGFGYDGYDIFQNGNYDLNNGKGRLTSAWTNLNNNGVTLQDAQSTFEYDSMGRAVANWQCVYFPAGTPCGQTNYTEFQYSYDYIGDILSQGNATATYTNTYNNIGQITNINTNYLNSTSSGTLATGFTYNAFGKVTYDTLANGLSETFNYDITGKPNYFNLSSWQYAYGTSGNYPNTWVGPYLTASGDSENGNWNYSYDSFGLLSGAACLGPVCPSTNAAVSYGYKYDRYGNRWQQNVISGMGTTDLLTFNSNNQVTSNTYDGFGNATNDGTHGYTYDYANRVIGVDGNGTETNTYDAFGRLASRTNSSGTYEYLYDLGGKVASTLTSAGAVVQPEIYIGGRHWGSIISNSTVFMHTDWLGTGRVWTSLSGSTYKACQNLPFGDGQSCQGSGPATEFSELLFDANTNLWNAGFRNQSPTQGHWMSPDPAGLAVADPSNPQTWNRYAYVMNSPLSFIDPTGLACYPLERAMFGSCAGFEGNGVSFGESSNEFDLMSIPIVTTAWGWVANSPGSGVSAPFNLMVSNTQVLAYWGQVTMQVGTGFDLLSGYCALFCGANGNNLFNKLYPLQALPTSTASNPPQPTVGDAEATCAVDAANANNGLGLYNNLPASGTESNSTGVVYSMETNHGFQPMNPSAEPAANAAQAFAPPGIFFSASVSNCMLDRAK